MRCPRSAAPRGPPRDRRRRHGDLAGRDRPGARPLRPRARPRLPPDASRVPAHPRRLAAMTLERAPQVRGPAPRSRADDRRRRDHPDRGAERSAWTLSKPPSTTSCAAPPCALPRGAASAATFLAARPVTLDQVRCPVESAEPYCGAGPPAATPDIAFGRSRGSAPPAAQTTRSGPFRHVPLPVPTGPKSVGMPSSQSGGPIRVLGEPTERAGVDPRFTPTFRIAPVRSGAAVATPRPRRGALGLVVRRRRRTGGHPPKPVGRRPGGACLDRDLLRPSVLAQRLGSAWGLSAWRGARTPTTSGLP